jgi:hypothetical protein
MPPPGRPCTCRLTSSIRGPPPLGPTSLRLDASPRDTPTAHPTTWLLVATTPSRCGPCLATSHPRTTRSRPTTLPHERHPRRPRRRASPSLHVPSDKPCPTHLSRPRRQADAPATRSDPPDRATPGDVISDRQAESTRLSHLLDNPNRGTHPRRRPTSRPGAVLRSRYRHPKRYVTHPVRQAVPTRPIPVNPILSDYPVLSRANQYDYPFPGLVLFRPLPSRTTGQFNPSLVRHHPRRQVSSISDLPLSADEPIHTVATDVSSCDMMYVE